MAAAELQSCVRGNPSVIQWHRGFINCVFEDKLIKSSSNPVLRINPFYSCTLITVSFSVCFSTYYEGFAFFLCILFLCCSCCKNLPCLSFQLFFILQKAHSFLLQKNKQAFHSTFSHLCQYQSAYSCP